MKVSELEQWPKIYKLCEEYWDEDLVICGTKEVGMGFLWDRTPQGDDFWGALYDGDIEKAKLLQPHLFEEEQQPDIDSEGFIKWDGGDMPVHEGTRVQVKTRDGSECTDTAERFAWCKGCGIYTIVAYKVIEDDVKEESYGSPKSIIDAHNTVVKTEFNPPKAGGSEYKITGTISLSEERRSGVASLQEPHKPLIVGSKLKYLKLGDEVLFDYRQDTSENNYIKQPLQDAYKAWAFSEPFGVPWLDGERKQLQEFKLNTRKSLNKLAVQGLVSGDMIAKFDELLKEI